MIGVRADFTGAQQKMGALASTPRAMRFQATRWATDTVKALKRSAASMQKGHKMGHGKTAQLGRAVGMRVASAGNRSLIVSVGTGITSPNPVKYARIQDEGGTVTAKNARFTIQNIAGKPTLGPYLTVPLKGVKGRMKDYPGSFVIRTKKGTLLAVMQKWGKVRGGENSKRKGIIPLFVLKYSVNIPASRWFTGVIDYREPLLHEMMDPAVVYNIASQMAGRGGA
jgi:hypothetical protein